LVVAAAAAAAAAAVALVAAALGSGWSSFITVDSLPLLLLLSSVDMLYVIGGGEDLSSVSRVGEVKSQNI
jgi:hypothetical protein